MRYLLLALTVGCMTSDPAASQDPADPAGAIGYENVAAIAACPTGQWCVETAPVTTGPLLHGVWAVSASDVFAVGDGGAIFRRTGGNWTVMASGSTQNLRGVWAASSSDVWAVGVGATILRFNGTAWRTVTPGTTSDIDAVWGSSSTNVWLAGGGTVLHWNGTSFTTFGFGGIMLSVAGTGPNDVWVTGENTNLHHFTGTSFTTVNPGAGTSSFFAVFALATNDVWAADFIPGKETMHFTGGAKWVAQRTGGAIFDGMAGLSSSDVWGAGGSRTGHWNGSAWTIEQPFGSNASMWSITTTAGNAWLVGDSGLIAHRTF